VKPEIAAPGVDIIMALARDENDRRRSKPLREDDYFEFDGLDGTSYAAPLVAGACALLFEAHGRGLRCADLKHLLLNAARTDPSPPDRAAGFGFLRMAGLASPPAEGTPGGSLGIETIVSGGEAVTRAALSAGCLVRVRVTNRAAWSARNLEVSLSWTEPARQWSEWRRDGVYDRTLVEQANRQVIRDLAGGKTATLTFGWRPPAPLPDAGAQLLLVARVARETDAPEIALTGQAPPGPNDEIAFRTVTVSP
jgi:hypothetical protein